MYLRHVFSLSQFDFRVVPLFSIINSLMVRTTVIPLNFRWLPPHLQFPLFVHESNVLPMALRFFSACFQLVVWKKTHYTFSQTLMPGLIFIIAFMFIAMRLFLLVRYANMNFVKYLTICPRNCASCRITLLF